MLTKITVEGFKSIRHAEVELREGLTLLIGPSGAGKSNLLDALQLACEVGVEDTASTFMCGTAGMDEFLHHGREVGLLVELRFTSGHHEGEVGYPVKMEVVDNYRFISEHGLGSAGEAGREVQKTLAQARSYHFRDARSLHTPPRKNTISQSTSRDEEDDVRTLRSDGSNLALLLYTLSQSQDDGDKRAWKFIQGLVRQVAPFIRELRPQVAPFIQELRPTPIVSHLRFPEAVNLSWVDERGVLQHSSRLSDGILRAIALFTALLQPNRPSIISIDEPELSQPTTTLELFMELAHSTRHAGQVLVATQSTALLDLVTLDKVVVVGRHDGASTFTRYSEAELYDWLEEYSLSQLYAKNVLGGRP